ncbi:MAG TPA: KH domain-containing protein, partial [Candidatus Thermoplasmatota archaeon]|nr:KH domain-containing protein [Candidatus Thermoplasmatota archaeon]
MIEGVRIPTRRVGALIGPEGKVKKELEERSGVTLLIDGQTGDVVFRDEKAFDALVALKVREVVRAIGRGFSPEHAMRLFQDDVFLEVVDIAEYVGKRADRVSRVRARLIGTSGRTRRTIETS